MHTLANTALLCETCRVQTGHSAGAPKTAGLFQGQRESSAGRETRTGASQKRKSLNGKSIVYSHFEPTHSLAGRADRCCCRPPPLPRHSAAWRGRSGDRHQRRPGGLPAGRPQGGSAAIQVNTFNIRRSDESSSAGERGFYFANSGFATGTWIWTRGIFAKSGAACKGLSRSIGLHWNKRGRNQLAGVAACPELSNAGGEAIPPASIERFHASSRSRHRHHRCLSVQHRAHRLLGLEARLAELSEAHRGPSHILDAERRS